MDKKKMYGNQCYLPVETVYRKEPPLKNNVLIIGKTNHFYTLDAFQKSTIIDDIVLVVGEDAGKTGSVMRS